jgi:tetratricopeptide (TPR) repeat protein
MDKKAIICLFLVILYPASAYAEKYVGTRFIVESNLDPHLVKNLQKKADAFYTELNKKYSLPGWIFPLTIYYSKNESQTNQLLSKYGFIYLEGNSYYTTGSPTVYIHQFDEKGQTVDEGLLFYGITRHFIAQNLKKAPEWFKEGLSCFLTEQASIVSGKLIISDPKPGSNIALKDKIEKGSRPNIKMMFTWDTPEKIKGYEYGCHLAREFFYWLYETNQLARYLSNVQKSGFDLTVLEKSVSKDFGKINLELLEFLNKTCFSQAQFSEALGCAESTKKQETLLKTLELKQDYHKARLELVKYFHDANNLPKCKEHLEQILSSPVSSEHMPAAILLGNVHYINKDYQKAIEYYTKAWDYSVNYDYSYRIAYRIANSYNHLKDTASSRNWYETFLVGKWNPDDMKLCADYAQRYVDYVKKNKQVKPANRTSPFTKRK